jgi:capsular polysaccharide biosynthesis protein
MIACYSPYTVRFLREKFLSRADTTYHGPKRFFITRRNVGRNVGNSVELEQFFAGIGWGVVDLRDLTFAQEIQLFAQAEAVCGMMGSGTTNVVFSQPGCAVISLMHDYWTDGVLDWIVQVVGIAKYSVHVYPSDACRRWRVDLDVLKRQLQSVGLL